MYFSSSFSSCVMWSHEKVLKRNWRKMCASDMAKLCLPVTVVGPSSQDDCIDFAIQSAVHDLGDEICA